MSQLLPFFEEDKKPEKMYINVLNEHVKTEKEVSKLEIESELQTKVENMELRGSAWRFIRYIPRTVVLMEKKQHNEHHL